MVASKECYLSLAEPLNQHQVQLQHIPQQGGLGDHQASVDGVKLDHMVSKLLVSLHSSMLHQWTAYMFVHMDLNDTVSAKWACRLSCLRHSQRAAAFQRKTHMTQPWHM